MEQDAPSVGPIAAAIREGTLSLNRAPEFSTSASIGKIAAALAAAQAEITQPTKAADNPYFKSKYAPLDVVWGAARAALSKHSVAVVQSPTYEVVDLVVESKTKADGSIESMKTKKYGVVTLVTMFVHSSGEWMKSTHYGLAENIGPQGAQATLTYMRRAALSAMAMVTPQDEDDDAESASNHSKPSPAQIDAWSKHLSTAAKSGSVKLKEAWEQIPTEAQPFMEALKNVLKPVALKVDATIPAPKMPKPAETTEPTDEPAPGSDHHGIPSET